MTAFSAPVGYVAVAVAIIFFGSFNVPLKSRRIQQLAIDPMVNQLYMMVSIFVLNWLSLAVDPSFEFTAWGVVAAAMWVPCNVFAVVAIRFLGLGVAQATWCSLIMTVSFFWGAVVFAQPLKSLAGSVIALLVLVSGVVILGLVKTDTTPVGKSPSSSAQHNPQQMEDTALVMEKDLNFLADNRNIGLRNKLAGIACCSMTGLLAGSMMVPSRFNPNQSFNYCASFGIGVLLVTPVVAVIWFLGQYLSLRSTGQQHQFAIRFHPKEAAGPCLLVGALWSGGNAGATVAVMSPLGLTVGYPLTQVALLVAGLWSLLLLKEIRGTRHVLHFIAGAAVVLLGAVLLALFGSA